MSNFIIRVIKILLYLKIRQIYSQVLYRLFSITNFRFLIKKNEYSRACFIKLVNYGSFKENINQKLEFDFLNIKHSFSSKVDWNYLNNGMLWAYNLNYFDFIYNYQKDDAIDLLLDFHKRKSSNSIGSDPYPISIRNINLIKFISRNNIINSELDSYLFNDYILLFKKLEYHLLGNHLLENGFSILFGAYYFHNNKFLHLSKKIIIYELNEQVLEDGMHFELSPMYHIIILNRVLESIDLVTNNSWNYDLQFLSFLRKKAMVMIGWINNISFKNGLLPMVNDTSYDIASKDDLFNYAKKLGVSPLNNKFHFISGYRKFVNNDFEMFVDVANIMASYIPGHTHADTFNFILHYKELPFIVDTGVSTYEKDSRRCFERSTESHNTVVINDQNSSDVWGGFRVGNRASVSIIEDNMNDVTASHDGYKKLGVTHVRRFNINNNGVLIQDKIIYKNQRNVSNCFANFHFDNNVIVEIVDGGYLLRIDDKKLSVVFTGASKIDVMEYKLAKGFNKTVSSKLLRVYFRKKLKTIIREYD